MGARRDPVLTTSFVKLRRLVVGFDHLRDGRPESAGEERALLRIACQLGATALRVLLGELGSTDDGRARWAHTLLAHMARGDQLRGRIVADLGALLRRPDAPDRAKLRALTVLAELDAELPGAELADPDDARRRSLHELALCLDSPAGVARAADHLIDGLSPEDMLDLFDELVESEPVSALALLDELLVRDELDDGFRHELRQRRASARQIGAHGRPAAPRRAAPAPRTRFARHADGRRILITCARQAGARPPRRRLLCLLVSADGHLLDGYYAEDLTAGAIERQFAAPLAEQGFELEPAGLDAARGFVIQAARAAVRAGRALPRAFYLGRDMLGLRDEHLDGTPRHRAEVDLAALLDRAIELVAAGEPAQARPLLERYVAEVPDDPEGHAQLGLCHLGLGDGDAALHHLGRATWLVPDEALYHWNTSAAAHALGHPGACYLALRAYLDLVDRAPGWQERRSTALGYLHEYERLAQLEHPGVAPEELALAEAGRSREAAPGGRRQVRPRRGGARR
ncbi:MAG TPA: tetratricopeptide repeat protein [Kofleriaceae bacterium]|nr:tetratricopeptide repeat protein [Kofleriaceae bacterium]